MVNLEGAVELAAQPSLRSDRQLLEQYMKQVLMLATSQDFQAAIKPTSRTASGATDAGEAGANDEDGGEEEAEAEAEAAEVAEQCRALTTLMVNILHETTPLTSLTVTRILAAALTILTALLDTRPEHTRALLTHEPLVSPLSAGLNRLLSMGSPHPRLLDFVCDLLARTVVVEPVALVIPGFPAYYEPTSSPLFAVILEMLMGTAVKPQVLALVRHNQKLL